MNIVKVKSTLYEIYTYNTFRGFIRERNVDTGPSIIYRLMSPINVINIRRVAETQMISVRKRNIQGRYNSVRHLQRWYLQLPPLHVVSIVTSKVPISLENTKTTRTRLSAIHLKA